MRDGWNENMVDLCRLFWMRVRKRMEVHKLSGKRVTWEQAAEEELEYLEENNRRKY